MTKSLLPCVKVSTSLRKAGFRRVVGHGSSVAWIEGTVAIAVCVEEDGFHAVLLNEWCEDSETYESSNDVYNDSIASTSWKEVITWVKRKLRN